MPDIDTIVTDHCALRYLQRALEIDIGRDSPSGEARRLKRLCENLGVTPLALKAAILAPPVLAALAAGSEKIFYAGVWITFQNGRATTILSRAMRYKAYRDAMRKLSPSIPDNPSRQNRRIRLAAEAGL